MKRNNLSTTSLKDCTYNNSNTSLTNKSQTKESNYANNNNNKNQMMVKDFLDCNNNNNYNYNSSHSNTNGEDYLNGVFPWPPRSYTCSFCRKEFKSAQALGGHMNVHRRDRARLRHSSPPPPTPTPTIDQHHGHHGHGHGHPMLNLNLNPNTNPNLFTSSSSSNVSLLPSSWSSHSSSHKPPLTSSTLPLFVSPPTTLPTLSSPPSYASTNNTSELKSSRWVVVDGILLKNPLSTKPTKPRMMADSLGGIDDDDDECKIMKKKNEILRMDLEIGLPRDYDLDLELRLGNYS